jgi:hypothetical protein
MRRNTQLAAAIAAILVFAAAASAASGGYLTTPAELAQIRQRGGPAVHDVVAFADTARLPEPDRGRVACSASRRPVYITGGGPTVYAWSLAFHLTQDRAWIGKIRAALRDVQQVTELEAGDCPLTMGRHIPDWIRAADLMDDYWPAPEKRAFQNWLAAVIYPSLATKYRRGNNWGAVITNAGQYIADYLHDRADLRLDGHTPAAAYAIMRQTALDRMNGALWDQCGQGVSMIRPDGGIPEEIRRSTTCDDTRLELNSSAHHYTEGFLSGLISQAELCLRRDDRALYDNVNTSGSGSIRKAIEFVLNQIPWQRTPTLWIAARYYRDPRMIRAATRPFDAAVEIRDYTNHFTLLTHAGLAFGRK